MTPEQLLESIRSLQAQMQTQATQVATMAADTNTSMEALLEQQATLANQRTRLDILTQQRAALLAASAPDSATPLTPAPNPQRMERREAYGAFYRAALTGSSMQSLPRAAYEHLGAIPAGDDDLGHGDRLLPTTMADYLLTEPVDVNPLREVMEVTDVPGLVIPVIAFTLDDDDFKTDKQLAAELKANADEPVVFGRFKSHVMAKISDTVMHGSNYDIEGKVTGAIRTQLGLRELRKITAVSPPEKEKHMSLYATGITEVTGETMYDAIRKAFAALHEMFRARATVVMSFAHYTDMISDLRKVNPAFFAATPEAVLGVPKVLFCDSFTQPVVGDYEYLHLNYDGAGTFDTDKDITKGVHLFSETDWYDIHVKLKSAFRRVKVTPAQAG